MTPRLTPGGSDIAAAEVSTGQERGMLLTITAIVVLETWAAGFLLDITFDGMLHALIPIAGALVIAQLVLGRPRTRPHELGSGNFPKS